MLGVRDLIEKFESLAAQAREQADKLHDDDDLPDLVLAKARIALEDIGLRLQKVERLFDPPPPKPVRFKVVIDAGRDE